MSKASAAATKADVSRAMRMIRAEIQGAAKITAQTGGLTPQRYETRWRGASQTLRSLAGWIPWLGSGRADQPKSERDRLAARSYDAYRNHALGRAAITRARTAIVGTGVMMHPAVDAKTLGITEEQAEELNELIAAEWAMYIDNPRECDFEGTADGYAQQGLALITALLAGDCWANTPMMEREGCVYETKLQLIDPARVCNPNDSADTVTMQDGVEMSIYGEPIAVHVRSTHPGDRGVSMTSFPTWQRIPIYGPSGARRVFQIWNDRDRIGTTRGVAFLSPILEPLQTLEQYSRAELMAAVVSAMFTVFIERAAPEQVDARGNPIAPIDGQTVQTPSGPQLAIGPAAIVDLAPGEKANMANPSRPNANFDPFFMSIVTQMGATLEIPADELLLKYQSSYSAARAAMLQAWRMYTMRRWWLIQQLCAPQYQLWFEEAVALGRIPASDFADPKRRAAYTAAIWIGPAKGAMDENQEASAAGKRIEIGVSNETIETAQMTGEPWRQVYRTRQRELAIRKKDGALPSTGPGSAPAAAPVAPGAPGSNVIPMRGRRAPPAELVDPEDLPDPDDPEETETEPA